MSRLFGLTLVVLAAAAPARAADPPERLLSPTTQLYVRWDGVTPHKAAYQASIWGPIMAGPTGDSIRTLLAKAPKLLGSDLLAGPLLEGRPPEELRAVHTDLKHLEKVVDLLADKGVLVAAEVRGPQPTLKGLGKAIGGLLGGEGPDPSTFVPEAMVFVIVPDVGDRAETLFAPTRLMLRNSGPTAVATPLPAELGVKGYNWSNGPLGGPVQLGEWVIDGHFVEYIGTVPVEQAIKKMRENLKAGGITSHPLFARGRKLGTTAGFEAVTCGFVDAKAVVGLAKRLGGPLVPGLTERVDGVGLGNLEAVVFASGFAGKESRGLWEFDLPGERKGLAKVLKKEPLTLADLPPMPPDVSRFAALRVDPAAAYDAGLTVIEALTMNDKTGAEDAKTAADQIRLRKEYMAREIDKFAGISVTEDLLPFLGDKVVIYQSPVEGLSVFGTVVCLSCKDPARVKAAVDRLQHPIERAVGGGPAKVRKKQYRGVEVREMYGRGFGVLTPTYAIVGEWLVIAAAPQPVYGFVLRHKGEIEKWAPDAETGARLAKMLRTEAVGIQYCTPKSVVHNLCCIGPLFLSAFTRFARADGSGDFDPIDLGLIPNGHELGKHLFPNLTVTRDDGKTVRIDVNESFGLPLEFAGLEVLVFAAFAGVGFF
jgi:hypothetical protein